jgi:hypothetical protein
MVEEEPPGDSWYLQQNKLMPLLPILLLPILLLPSQTP